MLSSFHRFANDFPSSVAAREAKHLRHGTREDVRAIRLREARDGAIRFQEGNVEIRDRHLDEPWSRDAPAITIGAEST